MRDCNCCSYQAACCPGFRAQPYVLWDIVLRFRRECMFHGQSDTFLFQLWLLSMPVLPESTLDKLRGPCVLGGGNPLTRIYLYPTARAFS